MARARWPISDSLPAQLLVSKGALDRRWGKLTEVIGRRLNYARQELQVSADYTTERVSAGLIGSACERVMRNRGGASFVAPINVLRDDFCAWLGLQEVWDVGSGQRPYAFKQLGVTVHFGYKGDPIKPQVFRSEWVGVRDWDGTGINFQSPGAGHPHWQIDIMETMRIATGPVAFDHGSEHVEDFSDEAPSVDALVRLVTIESVHFASGAHWWALPPADGLPLHVNAPGDDADLTRWLESSLSYIKQELERCRLRSS